MLGKLNSKQAYESSVLSMCGGQTTTPSDDSSEMVWMSFKVTVDGALTAALHGNWNSLIGDKAFACMLLKHAQCMHTLCRVVD